MIPEVPRRKLSIAAALLVVLFSATGTRGDTTAGESEEAPEPWLAPAFSATSEALLVAAERIPAPDAEVLMLYQDVEISVDGDHRVTYRRRWVYRVLAPEALESWSASEARWSPWHQDPPRIRARVLTPRGPIWVDPSVFRDGSVAEPDPSATASRILRTTLPEVTVGAVVEEEVLIRDYLPSFAAGISRRELLVLPVPIHRGRLMIEAPAGAEVRQLLRQPPTPLAPVEVERQEADGKVRWTFHYRDMPAATPVAAGLPANRVRHPHVAWSSGSSWQRVAVAFSDLVDQRIEGVDARRLLPELAESRAAAQTERMAEILAAVRQRLRYEPLGSELADPVPSPPRTVLERGTADAKDLATLLVALLRAEDIPAYVALASSAPGQDVESELPGLGTFDHALVYLPAGRPIWIDPSDRFSRVGELPAALQDRRALVASPATRSLIRTPSTVAEDHRTVLRVDVELAAKDGPAHIVETGEYHGEPERNQRQLALSLDAASRRRAYLEYVRSVYHARSLGAIEETEAEYLGTPYRLRLEALDASRGFTSGEEAALAIELQGLLAQLPAELFSDGGLERVDDFVFPVPFVTEWNYRVVPPPGMTPTELPESATLPLADSGILTRKARIDGGAVVVELRLDSGSPHLSPAQLAAYRADLREILVAGPLVLWFERQR